ncbi:hypothetical protein EK21DRAFT_53670 [Setomelanomma holmii]|uniref:Uncharacterized protein n=1 Tax=Setomelanomma holmii TaxID=210430 RepID=A0A9P4HIH2_9PLEO|nr:hypothetical protein EK21DRAFT_53670 [Setomelanomma holmii]
MYITSDLFGGTSTHQHNDTNPATQWTIMADSPHTAGLGKRKRLEGEDGPNRYGQFQVHSHNPQADDSCDSSVHQQRSSPTSRGYARMHVHNNSTLETSRNLSYPIYSAVPIYASAERRPVKQMKRHNPKATLVKSTSHLMDFEHDLPPSITKVDTHSHTANDLRPCHACKSAPKRRRDLENYLDCRRCEGRTCYICARQCFGGCGKAVCKKCIVEVGEEGDPWCLDCYARRINI